MIGQLNKGQRFEVDGQKSGEWVHVKVAGYGMGYIHEDYVVYDTPAASGWMATGTATCIGSNVNVRQTPGGTVIGQLGISNRFEVDGQKSGEWVHIKVAGIGVGYIHQNYVKYD